MCNVAAKEYPRSNWNKRIAFYQPYVAEDEWGDIIEVDESTSPTTKVAERWAQVSTTGAEQVRATDDVMYERVDMQIITSYSSTLMDHTLKLKYKGKWYDIVSIDNVHEENTTVIYKVRDVNKKGEV